MRLHLLLLLFLAIPSSAPGRGIVRIDADVTVLGPDITIAEIATLDGLSEREQEFVSELSLGKAAEPARMRNFSGAGISHQLLAVAPNLFLDIAEEVRVHTAYREISGDEIRERFERAIQHRMPWPKEAVRFSRWQTPELVPVPVDAKRLLVRFRPEEDFLGHVAAEFEYVDPNNPQAFSVSRTAAVEVDVRLQVVVTQKRLRRGDILGPENIRLEARDLRALPREILTDVAAVEGHRLAQNLAEGVPVVFRHVVAEQLVKRGDSLLVEAMTPGLEVRIEARALEHGVLGQVIKAENPATRRRFQVEIAGPGRGRMQLPDVGTRR